MKSANDLSKAIRAGTITVGLMVLAQSPVQAAVGGLPNMLTINLMQPVVSLRQGIEPPAASVTTTPEALSEPTPPLDVVAEAAHGYVVFANNAHHLNSNAAAWPQVKLQTLVDIYDEAILGYYAAEDSFGSVKGWAKTFGISKSNPIVIIYVQGDAHGAPARAAWQGTSPVVTHYTLRTAVPSQTTKLILHELAHIWDHAHDWTLSEQMVIVIQNPEGYPTAKARNEGPKEDFAESVTAALWQGYAVNATWSDNDSAQPDAQWTLDRHDYVDELFGTP